MPSAYAPAWQWCMLTGGGGMGGGCSGQKTGGGLQMWKCSGGPRHHTCPPVSFRGGRKPREERMYGPAFWGMNNLMIRATDGVRSRAGNPLRYQLCLGAAYISTDDKNVCRTALVTGPPTLCTSHEKLLPVRCRLTFLSFTLWEPPWKCSA